MKNLLIYLILISYLNMALVPHLSETDTYIKGTTHAIDEINSLYEQVMVWVGWDITADDEDGDSGTEDDGTIVSSLVFYFAYLLQNGDRLEFSDTYLLKSEHILPSTKTTFNLTSIDYGIESPPPEV